MQVFPQLVTSSTRHTANCMTHGQLVTIQSHNQNLEEKKTENCLITTIS